MTNKGITWATWVVFNGNTEASLNRFKAMDMIDWTLIFKPQYWDKCYGGAINSQRVANFVVDWCYTSGQHYPELHIEQLINVIFKKHLQEDGIFGIATIAAINEVDEQLLYENLIIRRKQYYKDIVTEAHLKNDFSQDKFEEGWQNRVDRLVEYNIKLIGNA
jgi:lysozyme family protein